MLRIYSFARVPVVLMSVFLWFALAVAAVLAGSIPAKAAPVAVHPASAQQDTGKIVFASERDGNREIYVMDADGGNPTNLTQHEAVDDQPVWSPDGSKIAFASLRDSDWEVYVMDADGSNLHNLTNSPGTDFIPAWSPDGSQIAFTSERDGNLEIYVMDADGGNPTRLTTNDAIDEQAAWSPDGSKILFASNRDGDHEVYVMDANGNNPIQLTSNEHYDYRGEWSPDGSQIAFSTNRDGNFEIYIMEAGGGSPNNISNNPAGDFRPYWSVDGSQIVFFSDRDGNYEIYTMNADGSNQVRLTTTGATNWNPAWTGRSEPGEPPVSESFPPVIHAILPHSVKATLNANPTHGYIGQKVTLSGQLSAGYNQVQIVTVMNGQTLRTQVAQAAPGGAYSTEFTIPDNAAPGKLEVCAAVAGIGNAEYSCLELQIDQPPGGTVFGNVPGSLGGGATKVALLNAAGSVLYSAPVGANGDFSIASIIPGTYKTIVLGAVQEPVIDGIVALRPDIPIQVHFNQSERCFIGRNHGHFEVAPTRTTFRRLRGSTLTPPATSSSPFGIYVSGVPLQVTFTASPQEINGPIQKVVFKLVNTNGVTVATIEDTVAPWSATFNVGDLSPAAGDKYPYIRAEAYGSGPSNCPTVLSHDIEMIANPFARSGIRPNAIVWDNAARLYRINAIFPHIEGVLPANFKFPPPPVEELPFFGRLDNQLDAGIHLFGTISLSGDVHLIVVKGKVYTKLMNEVLLNEEKELVRPDFRTKLSASTNRIDLTGIGFDLPPIPLVTERFTVFAIKAPVITLLGIVDVLVNANLNIDAKVLLRGHIKPLAPEVTATLEPTLHALLALGASVRVAAGVAEGGVEGRASVNASAPLNVMLLPDPSANLKACLNLKIDVTGYVVLGIGFISKRINIAPTDVVSYNDCVNVIDVASIQQSDPPDIPELYAAPAIAIAPDGTQLAAYVENTASVGGSERIQVMARFKAPSEDTWGEAMALTDPTHAARSPVVAFVGPDATPVVAWVENTLTAEEAEALGDEYNAEVVNTHLGRQEIVYSIWNGDSWNTPVFLTNDLMADGLPAMAGSNAGAVLAWTRDSDGDVTTRADQQIAVALYNFGNGHFEAPELLTGGDGLNADVAVAYDKSVDPAQPYLAWIHDADADLITASDRTLTVASFDGSNWSYLDVKGLPLGVDSPAITANAQGIQLAFLVREASADGSVGLLGTNGATWTALYQGSGWSAQPLLSALGEPIYGERPILDSQGEESLLVFRRFGESGNTSVLGQIAMSQFMAGDGPTAPLYLTDQAIQNWQPALAMNPLDGNAVILKVARTTSVSAVALETATSLDSIAATEVMMAVQTTTLSAHGDVVEEVDVTTSADPALAPLEVSIASPAPDEVVNVRVTVRNAGRNAAGDITVSLYSGKDGSGTLIDSKAIPAGLGFNGSFVAHMALTASGGEQPIYAQLTTNGENQSDANDRVAAVLGRLSTPTMGGIVESAEYLDALSITWATTPHEYVAGYRILRSTTEEGSFELVGEASITSFTDTLVQPGQTYCYAVQAYNTNTFSIQSPALCGALPMDALFVPFVQR